MAPQRPLYGVLGVSADATDSEISRAYRRLALQYHPDRNPDGENKFKEIGNAYSVLSDADRRRVYDATGIITGNANNAEAENAENAAERSEEIRSRVQEFYANYAGSNEEIDDVIKCYNKCKGNFRRMMREELLFDNSGEGEITRLHTLVIKLIEDGKVQRTEAWNLTSSAAVLKKISQAMKKERRDAAEALDAMGLSSDKNNNNNNSGVQALQTLMRRDQQANWEKMMSDMESKYLKPKKKTVSGKKMVATDEAEQQKHEPRRKKMRPEEQQHQKKQKEKRKR